MGETTTIGWTDKTHNEWIGCQKVTEAECGDCYAWRWATRHGLDVWGSLSGSHRHLTKTHDNPRKWNNEAQTQGTRFKVFCASLSDVFEPHPQVAEARKRLWRLIEETPIWTGSYSPNARSLSGNSSPNPGYTSGRVMCG